MNLPIDESAAMQPGAPPSQPASHQVDSSAPGLAAESAPLEGLLDDLEPIGAPQDRFEPALDQVADGSRSRDGYAVHLKQFEGPLDLLLHLVRRHELDVLDIPIHFVATKYLEYVKFASALDIELAGEYLVMAATLAYLKSRELLPSIAQEVDTSVLGEDGVDPRDELIRRLVEYERFRAAAASLDALPMTGRDIFGRGGELGIFVPAPDLAPITLFRLADAFSRVLERARVLEEHAVELEPVSVRQRMEQLALLLIERPKISLESLFLDRVWRSERELRQMLVVTLLSILELVKLGVLGVEQGEGSEHVSIERVGELESLKSAVEGYREEEEEEVATPVEPVDFASLQAAETETEAEVGGEEEPFDLAVVLEVPSTPQALAETDVESGVVPDSASTGLEAQRVVPLDPAQPAALDGTVEGEDAEALLGASQVKGAPVPGQEDRATKGSPEHHDD